MINKKKHCKKETNLSEKTEALCHKTGLPDINFHKWKSSLFFNRQKGCSLLLWFINILESVYDIIQTVFFLKMSSSNVWSSDKFKFEWNCSGWDDCTTSQYSCMTIMIMMGSMDTENFIVKVCLPLLHLYFLCFIAAILALLLLFVIDILDFCLWVFIGNVV